MKDKINMGMNIPAVKGHCKIELFENGEKVKEIEQDNYVHPKYLGALNKLYSYRAFEFGTNVQGTALVDNNTMGARGGAERVPFRGLLLTDAVHAEDPENERAVRGNIIGMSSLNDNNNQQSPFKGRYNISESEHTLDYHKFVYDFREDEVNGVIGSIYTVPGNSSSTTSAMITDKISVSGQNVSLTGTDRAYYGLAYADDTYVYFCQRSNHAPINNAAYNPNIYRIPKESIPQPGVAIVPEAVHMPVRPIRAITEKDGRLYMWGHLRHARDADVDDIPVRSSFVISSPKNDVANYRVEKLWSLTEINAMLETNVLAGAGTNLSGEARYISRMGDMIYDEENDNFLIMYKEGNNTTGSNIAKETVYRFDNEFNLINAIGGENWVSNGNLYDTETIVINNTIRRIADESLPEGPNIRTNRLGTSSGLAQSLKPYNDFFDMNSTDSGTITFSPAAHFFSRVLLTQPINKTNQQTMKITYEFTREPFSLDHIDDGSKYTPTTPTELHIHPVTVITPEEEPTPQTTPEHQYLLDALPEHTSSTNTNVIVTIRTGTKWAMYHSTDPLVSETADVGNKMIPGGTWDYYSWTGTEWKSGGSASTDWEGHGYIVYTAVDIVEQGTSTVLVPAGGNTAT